MSNRIVFDITEREVFADGHEFDARGPYERLVGRARFAVAPGAPAQAGIVDLDKAPVNEDGLVEFATDLCILKPVDMARGNRRLFFDYGNRGNKRALQFFNDGAATNDPRTRAHAGNGFLFRRGYTMVWGAWQGDLLPGDGRMVLDLPVAVAGDGPLTGLVRSEFIVAEAGQTTQPLSGRVSTRSHPVASADTTKARLTRRRYADDARVEIPPEKWMFARQEGGMGLDFQGAEQALLPSDVHLHLAGGFEPGWIYELIYEARDPLVLGLGHIVVRDLVSFLKYGGQDGAGAPNPLAGGGAIEKAYAWGRSQTGRCIRDLIHRGFNADAAGRKVFDGVLSHVAGGGRMWMNHRFANAVVPAGQQYEDHDNIADRFPFAYAESTCHLTGKTDAICKRSDTDPLIFHTQTATEYWQRRGSLAHTDSQGNDLAPPENVRVYFWASSQHFSDPAPKAPGRGVCQNLANIVQTSMLFRALLDTMDRWASDGDAPPDSRMPRRGDGTLATIEEWRAQFPDLPGIATPRGPNDLPLYDFGPQADEGILSTLPPSVVSAEGYAVLVPGVDSDGNDIAGVRAPMVAAPLGTYTGWNLRRRGQGEGAMHEFTGSYIPLPETEAVRRATGDPRASIEARYGGVDGYVAAIVAAAEGLVADGFMLEEDIARVAAVARDWSRPWHDVRF